jgi:16S rRNA (guanine966-N2)-methyltransferase
MPLKVLGGKLKARSLKTPSGDQTRPTTSLVRKSIFDRVQMMIDNALFLDLFAGSGAMGIEALSRGAQKAFFVESHRRSVSCIEQNLSYLGIQSHAEVLQMDVFKALIYLQKKDYLFDLVYADPPYNQKSLYVGLLEFFDKGALLKPASFFFLEAAYDLSLIKMETKKIRCIDVRSYGKSSLYTYQLLSSI